MKIIRLILLPLFVMPAMTFADDKPKPEAPAADQKSVAEKKSPEARIAELESRVMKLERELARLKGESKPAPASAKSAPTEEDRKRWEGLSESAKTKFRDELRKNFDNPEFRNLPVEEQRDRIKKMMEKIEAEDKAGKAK